MVYEELAASGVFLLTALVASDTVLGTLGHEPMLLFLSLILLMVGAASVLPWSTRVQVLFNLVAWPHGPSRASRRHHLTARNPTELPV